MNYYSFFFDDKSPFIMDIPGNSLMAAILKLMELHPEHSLASISVIIKQTGHSQNN